MDGALRSSVASRDRGYLRRRTEFLNLWKHEGHWPEAMESAITTLPHDVICGTGCGCMGGTQAFSPSTSLSYRACGGSTTVV